jgi:hypothetical protein
MTIDKIDSFIYFIVAVIVFPFQFGSIGIVYGFIIGLFLAWIRYNHY